MPTTAVLHGARVGRPGGRGGLWMAAGVRQGEGGRGTEEGVGRQNAAQHVSPSFSSTANSELITTPSGNDNLHLTFLQWDFNLMALARLIAEVGFLVHVLHSKGCLDFKGQKSSESDKTCFPVLLRSL